MHEPPVSVKHFQAQDRNPLETMDNFRKRDFLDEFGEAQRRDEERRRILDEKERETKERDRESKRQKVVELRKRLKATNKETDDQEEDIEAVISSVGSATTSTDEKNPKAESNSSGLKPKKVLKDVRFSLSGFQNPERSRLRELAVSMGAIFQDGVDASLTHLVCKFKNTPKAHRVTANVAVVSSAWLEQCAANNRRVPEHLYRVH